MAPVCRIMREGFSLSSGRIFAMSKARYNNLNFVICYLLFIILFRGGVALGENYFLERKRYSRGAESGVS